MHEIVIHDRFQRILESISLINERTGKIEKAKDLIRPEDGAMLLDSIALRLQVIGEHVKIGERLEKEVRYSLPKKNVF